MSFAVNFSAEIFHNRSHLWLLLPQGFVSWYFPVSKHGRNALFPFACHTLTKYLVFLLCRPFLYHHTSGINTALSHISSTFRLHHMCHVNLLWAYEVWVNFMPAVLNHVFFCNLFEMCKKKLNVWMWNSRFMLSVMTFLHCCWQLYIFHFNLEISFRYLLCF